MQQQRVEETVLPPSASRSGKNTTYIGCDVRHSRQNYGVCLFVIDAYENDRLDKNMSDCARAITGGYCEASKMHQKEKDAGRALFYKEREIKVTVVPEASERPTHNIDRNSPSYIRGWNAVGGKPSTRRVEQTSKTTARLAPKKTARKVKTVDAFEKSLVDGRGDLAKTLTDAAKQETKVEAKSPTPEKTNDTNANEARMKRAQRIAQLMKGKQNAK